MLERAKMLTALVRELHGPQFGQFEHLPGSRDPRSEYITGVLAPVIQERHPDPDGDMDELIVEVSDDEDQGAEGVVVAAPSVFSPALDPKAQPRSIGLSFVIVSNTTRPKLDVCASWARYEPHADGGWIRHPQAIVFNSISFTANPRLHTNFDVDLYVRARKEDDYTYRVSIYLVNSRVPQREKGAETQDFVFQPQIRVHCPDGTSLVSIDNSGLTEADDLISHEDAQLSLLYRNRSALARGHMCGAIWAAIDPERPLDECEAPPEAPFMWIDASLVAEGQRAKFTVADVRTEFFPSYSIESPEWEWQEQWGEPPELNPLVLAQTWEPDEIKSRLQPLVDGYRNWIAAQLAETAGLSPHWKPMAAENLDQCAQAAERMQVGIDWLVKDSDVRLAFCFANQALALQSQWSRQGATAPWRTFQLAFILLNITGLADPTSSDRNICDLLWFPTGGGKTEAYLGLSAFMLALRRRRAHNERGGDRAGRGVSVLSRYTLRLLTIQQFRRALGIITACEVLRVANLDDDVLPTGWRPQGCENTDEFLWGGVRFSAGLWVGGGVTPNALHSLTFPGSNGRFQFVAGAIDILRGVTNFGYNGPDGALRRDLQNKEVSADGEPAQVLTCPVCQSLLAVPEEGLAPGQHTLDFFYRGDSLPNPLPSLLNHQRIEVDSTRMFHHGVPGTHTLKVTFTIPSGANLRSREIDQWWYDHISVVLGQGQLLVARPSRPGYFLTSFRFGSGRGREVYSGFEIFCPNAECDLNQHAWAEQVPLEMSATSAPSGRPVMFSSSPESPMPQLDGLRWQTVDPEMRQDGGINIAGRIPIPAYTVDDQIYHRCPSLVIATVDKFARLAFEPKASAIFGNVSYYHSRWGYYRAGCMPDDGRGLGSAFSEHLRRYQGYQDLHVPVPAFSPPDLIIQDELHLIEGPLGSLVGLYEFAIDALSERRIGQVAIKPKYIASTATVRQAADQVQSLFDRRLAQFPPSATNVDDRFFARNGVVDAHPLDVRRAGRLYVGVAAPGKGAQTPIVRIWAALLQMAHVLRNSEENETVDGFWTLVGYFNALRELAGASALYRQDIRERLNEFFGPDARLLTDQALELSSRANSLALPGLLQRLSQPWSEDAVLATSMFGTGVDVDRLGLMVVHGQPKTTSSYIQATGRVGRKQGGLVVTFFRASRPRDLDHYEFFSGYHRMLYRAVEPVTVTPFAPRARERGIGAVALILLRQASQIAGQPVQQAWRIQQRLQGQRRYFSRAALMAEQRRALEVTAIPPLLESRAQSQPTARRPEIGLVLQEMASELDRWQSIAHDALNQHGIAHAEDLTDELVYNESSMIRTPQRAVILGDAQHQLNGLPVAFENAPTSLRDVEVTTQFKG